MTVSRAAFGVLAVAALLAAGSEVPAQYPEPRVRARPDRVGEAFRLFEGGQWQAALDAFEAAGRESVAPLPGEAMRRWGVAASEAGRPLTAYVRLRQYLATGPPSLEREGAVERIDRAREGLLTEAARFSRLLATAERRADGEAPGERHVVRVAARDGEVSLEGLSGSRVESPVWRRAEEIAAPPYLDLLRRLLDSPAMIDDVPVQAFDPNEPGPRRAAVLRLVVGDEERRLEALRGEPYERLRGAVGVVLNFARTVPSLPEPEPKVEPPRPPPAPSPKVEKKRR